LLCVIWVGLSLSIGWGIRGNFGHEYGAMIPGALAALAAVLLSGRSDWHRRGVFFAFFGALGWSFGGSISYMQVIAYTHSGHSGSVLYGFACLFVIGFLWAAMGGAGAGLPAVLGRERLTEFLAPLTAVFIGWTVQDVAVATWFREDSAYRQRSPLYWYDTDWLAALIAVVAVLVLVLARRRLDSASSLILHMAAGWWAGFLLLVIVLGWRMTPPRGDNWAGCVGMVAGMWVYFQRHGLGDLTFVSLMSGFIGGFGFAFADLLKLVGISSGWQTNWHSILEQTYGFINGIGLGVALFWLARHAPKVTENGLLTPTLSPSEGAREKGFARPEKKVRGTLALTPTLSPGEREEARTLTPSEGAREKRARFMDRWAEPYAAAFVLLVLTYLNLVKNPEEWVHAQAMPAVLYGLSAAAWFNLAYLALAVGFTTLLVVHRRRPLPLLSISWLARGQLLYLVFLWVMVLGNFERALVSFAPERLVTEGVIFLNAVLCTIGIFLSAPPSTRKVPETELPRLWWLPKTILVGLVAAALSVLVDWSVVRGIYGDRQVGFAARHIRFGPDATASKAKPDPSLPHP